MVAPRRPTSERADHDEPDDDGDASGGMGELEDQADTDELEQLARDRVRGRFAPDEARRAGPAFVGFRIARLLAPHVGRVRGVGVWTATVDLDTG